MRIHEIILHKIYLRHNAGAIKIFEAYTNPDSELTVVFRDRSVEDGSYYVEAVVSDTSGKPVLFVDFSLNKNNPNAVNVGNIYPSHDAQDKMVHTTT